MLADVQMVRAHAEIGGEVISEVLGRAHAEKWGGGGGGGRRDRR